MREIYKCGGLTPMRIGDLSESRQTGLVKLNRCAARTYYDLAVNARWGFTV
jgi:hypothetical protein